MFLFKGKEIRVKQGFCNFCCIWNDVQLLQDLDDKLQT